MKTKQCWVIVLLAGELLLGVGCVTQTERLPYRRGQLPPEEGILDEIKREIGWQSSSSSNEPFYKRAFLGMKNTVSGWLKEEDEFPSKMPAQLTEDERQRARQDLRDVMQKLREIQAQDHREAVRRLEEQRAQERQKEQLEKLPEQPPAELRDQ
jgi:uncharacterized membrane protein